MNTISAKEFDAKVNAGEDISEFVDWSKMRRPGNRPGHIVGFRQSGANYC
jgi:hypothetical protein